MKFNIKIAFGSKKQEKRIFRTKKFDLKKIFEKLGNYNQL